MSQTTTQTDDSIAFEAIVPAGALQEFLDPLSAIGSETRLEIREDEIASRMQDPANVAMAVSRLSSDAFESYRPGGGDLVLGVNLERMEEVLGFADGDDDLVHLQLDAETRLLEVQIDGFEWELALIDPDKVRSAPETPEVPFETVVGLTGGDVSDAISATDMTSSHVTLRGDASADQFVLEAEGDLERTSVSYGPDERLDVDEEEVSDCSSILSLEYLGDFAEAFGSDDEVVLRVGQDVPLFVEYDLVDGAGEALFMLAPRLKKD